VDILKNLSLVIRERLKIKRQVRVYTAQGRLSGYILGALPVFLVLFIYLFNPDYISVLFQETMGRILVAAALILQFIGFMIIRKIVRIKI
jgi:tight adherence protein B